MEGYRKWKASVLMLVADCILKDIFDIVQSSILIKSIVYVHFCIAHFFVHFFVFIFLVIFY